MDTQFTYPLAPVTTGRVIRLRRLLRESGLADGPAEVEGPPRPFGPRKLGDVAEADAAESITQTPAPTAAELSRVDELLWDEASVLDLTQILFDVTPEQAGDVPAEEVGLALIPFLGGIRRAHAAAGRLWEELRLTAQGNGPTRAPDTALTLTVSALSRAGLGSARDIEAMPFADVLRYNVTLHHQHSEERKALAARKR